MLGAISDVQIVGNPLFQEAMSEKTKNNSFVAEDLGTIALLSTRQASWAAPASCFLGWLCPEEKWLRTFAYERERGARNAAAARSAYYKQHTRDGYGESAAAETPPRSHHAEP